MDEIFGKYFKSIDELLDAKKRYEDCVFTNYYISTSLLLPRGDKYTDEDIKRFRYKSLKFSCIKGGKRFISHSSGQRNAVSRKSDCKNFVSFKLIALKSSYAFVLNKFHWEHNHPLSEESYMLLPRQRKMTESEVAMAKEGFDTDGNVMKLQSLLMQNGKVVLLKDLHNLRANLRNNVDKKDLINAIDTLCGHEGGKSVIEVYLEGKQFAGIYFQSRAQRELFNTFPQFLCVETGYKLNAYKLPFFLLMCIDNYGTCRVVASFLVKTTKYSQIRYFYDIFAKNNPAWPEVLTIITDNETAHRQALEEVFPAAKLELSPAYVYQTFRKEMCPQKMNLTDTQCALVHKILKSMLYSKSPSHYDQTYAMLARLNFPTVLTHFDQTWHGAREDWSFAFKRTLACRLNFTSGKGESYNCITAALYKRFASVNEFWKNYTFCMSSGQLETNVAKWNDKCCGNSSTLLRTPESHFNEMLTPFAFKIVSQQIRASKDIIALAPEIASAITPTNCTCDFFSSVLLPCSHIFKLRETLQLPLFYPALCHERWSKSIETNTSVADLTQSALPLNDGSDLKAIKVELTKSQKYEVFSNKLTELATIASELDDAKFDACMKFLDELKADMKAHKLAGTTSMDIGVGDICEQPLCYDPVTKETVLVKLEENHMLSKSNVEKLRIEKSILEPNVIAPKIQPSLWDSYRIFSPEAQAYFTEALHTNSEEGKGISSRQKKKRREYKSIEWRQKAIYDTEAEAKEALNAENVWGYWYKNETERGQKIYYRCKCVKYRGPQCQARCYLLNEYMTKKVIMYASTAQHSHEMILPTKLSNIKDPVKKEICKMFYLGIKPKAIMENIKRLKQPVPSMPQLRSFLAVLKKKNMSLSEIVTMTSNPFRMKITSKN